MQYTIIRRIVILGAIAIAGILGTQSYWLVTSWNINEQAFDQKARLALYNVAERLSGLNGTELPPRDIVRQRSGNTFVVNTESEIYAPMLEYLLQQELTKLALNVNFEYAIFDCSTNQMLYGGYCVSEAESLAAVQPPASNFAKEADFTYYFSVKFPGRSSFILQDMQLVLFLSGILLLTVFFFSYALVIILRQRRLATMQKDFINNMTHEFKTPLSTIRIAAGVFQRDERIKADDRLSRYADIIHEQYDRLNGQVEKVLQIAGVEEGGFKLNRENLELNQQLQPLLSSASLRVEEQGGKLVTELMDRPIFISADPMHLSNILHSLIDNAIKYGGPEPFVRVSVTEQSNERYVLSIEDHGPGIPPDQREKVFEKFYRIPTGNVHDVKGFGLGLYYVRSICKAHDWSINIHTAEPSGTRISITLPPIKPA
ncbi:two-component sensor histidine kinase [Lewinellaceae bacterium SD302]|nr:two-component sensor histidine kinase [Lewinellaceae bacterium SD302]